MARRSDCRKFDDDFRDDGAIPPTGASPAAVRKIDRYGSDVIKPVRRRRCIRCPADGHVGHAQPARQIDHAGLSRRLDQLGDDLDVVLRRLLRVLLQRVRVRVAGELGARRARHAAAPDISALDHRSVAYATLWNLRHHAESRRHPRHRRRPQAHRGLLAAVARLRRPRHSRQRRLHGPGQLGHRPPGR